MLVIHNIPFLIPARRAQFNIALYSLQKNARVLSEFPDPLPASNYLTPLPLTVEDYLNLPYFDSYIVGFTGAEGCFYFNRNADTARFSVVQKNQDNLLKAIGLRLTNAPKNLYLDKKNKC